MSDQRTDRSDPLRICYFGTYRANYERNRLMIERLHRQNIIVKECHATLWQGLEDREQVAGGGWLNPAFWLRTLLAYIRLIGRYLRVGDYDVMVIGYPGQPDVPLGWLLTRIRRKPLVWDILMSIHLISLERHIDARSPVSSRLIRAVESLSIKLPDYIIIDTPVYSEWYQKEYGLDPKKIRLLPLGADDRDFQPLIQPGGDDHFQCLYYGTYIPNHGVKYIVEAARLLADQPSIQFLLIGTGPDKKDIEDLVRQYQLNSVHFYDWMSKSDLIQNISRSDIVLGTFGTTPQALMTMQNKIFEGLAMAKPVVNGDSPQMRQTLVHGENIYLCERENPEAIADAILTLFRDNQLREKIALNGFDFYQENFTFDKLGEKFTNILREVANKVP